jgi:hypothetical protein
VHLATLYVQANEMGDTNEKKIEECTCTQHPLIQVDGAYEKRTK